MAVPSDPKIAALPKTQRRRLRLREVEELYLNGYTAIEIHDLIGARHGVTYGTMRHDIVAVRRIARERMEADPDETREQYCAALYQVRRKVMKGWLIGEGSNQKIVGRDYKLAHEIDKELARFRGLTLASDSRTLHLSIEKAREFMDQVMAAIFEVVTDEDMRREIVEKLEALE